MGQVHHGSATTTARSVERYSIVMSGRRLRIKGSASACEGRGCGHVFGLSLRMVSPAGPDGFR
jgi:hypothetical protein